MFTITTTLSAFTAEAPSFEAAVEAAAGYALHHMGDACVSTADGRALARFIWKVDGTVGIYATPLGEAAVLALA